jgi:hypothetical protein
MLYEWSKRILRNKVGSEYVEGDDVLSVVSVASTFAETTNSTTAIPQESVRPTARRAKKSTEYTSTPRMPDTDWDPVKETVRRLRGEGKSHPYILRAISKPGFRPR